MSDDDFVSADAGAAGTTPIRVGELKKGGMVMIKGHACKVSNPQKFEKTCSSLSFSFVDIVNYI